MRAVIFDAYGTLISTGTGSLDAAGAILRRNGREDIPVRQFYGRWKVLHREHIESLTEFKTEAVVFEADLRRLYTEYGLVGDAREDVCLMLDTLGGRRAFPEAPTVWKGLSGQYRLAIGSTTDTAPLLADLARAGIDAHHVYTSESLGIYKPRPAFYEAILRDLGVSPAETLFVGDSLTDDVAGPKRVGIRACWVNRRGQTLPSGAAPPDYTVADLTGLHRILNQVQW